MIKKKKEKGGGAFQQPFRPCRERKGKRKGGKNGKKDGKGKTISTALI